MSIQNYNPINWGKNQLLLFLRDFFGAQDRGIYRFDANTTMTEIHIRDKNGVRLDSPDDLPIIAVSRGGLNTQNRFIADFAAHDYTTGMTTYTDILTYSVTINCLSRVGLEAEEIASMVFGGIKFNRDYILSLGFLRVDPPAIGEEQTIIVNSDITLINVPVVTQVVYGVQWTSINREPVKLNFINVELVDIT